jgi:hypothetical protein
MNRSTKRAAKSLAITAIAALLATPAIVVGQGHSHSHDGHDHAAHGDHNHSVELIVFRLPDWKSMHFNEDQKAAQHAATVTKLGCEVKQGDHDGHTDVTYRCATWKTLPVKNHQRADQWSRWLSASGFDVSHGHTDPSYTQGSEVVEFRLVEWKNLHGDGSPNESLLIDQLRRIGCDVQFDKHDGHSDIRFRAPTWRDVHFVSHNDAHKLMRLLKQNGFEVRHEH